LSEEKICEYLAYDSSISIVWCNTADMDRSCSRIPEPARQNACVKKFRFSDLQLHRIIAVWVLQLLYCSEFLPMPKPMASRLSKDTLDSKKTACFTIITGSYNCLKKLV
jgi:hypothetical protein